MKKIRKLNNNNNSGIKRYLSPQPSHLPNKKQCQKVDFTDTHTGRNVTGVYLFAHNGNTNDNEISRKKGSNRMESHQPKDAIVPNKPMEKFNWNIFVRDPGELHELRYPVTFNTFKTMTHCLNVVKRILEDIKDITGLDFTNDELIEERVLKNFYIQFYEQPEIRNIYQLETKACPTFVKKKIMHIPTWFIETNEETTATVSTMLALDKCSKVPAASTAKQRKPIKTTDNPLPEPSKIENDNKELQVELEIVEVQPSPILDTANKSVDLKRVAAQSSQSIIHCEANNDQYQLENAETEEFAPTQQKDSQTIYRHTKKIYISKSVVFDDLEFLKTHISRRVQQAEKQQIILERITKELLQRNERSYATRQNVKRKDLVIKKNKSQDVVEEVINITDTNSQSSLVNLSEIERMQQAKEIFFQQFTKAHTLAYALRFHKGLKRDIIGAVLEMTIEEFQKYTKIYDAPEIYSDAELLKTFYNYAIKSAKIWPQNLYMLLKDLREYLKTKGVSLADDNLEDISPMLLHWQELSDITNFDEIVRWDYYRCKGEKFKQNTNSFDFYRKIFYEKCWLNNHWLREVPKLINVLDNNGVGIEETTPMEVDGDGESVKSANMIVEEETSINDVPKQLAVKEIEVELADNAQTSEMDEVSVEESNNTQIAVENVEHSNEKCTAQIENTTTVEAIDQNVELGYGASADSIAGSSTVHKAEQIQHLPAENCDKPPPTVETTVENQNTIHSDATVVHTPTPPVTIDETHTAISQDIEISNNERITQKRLETAKELYFKEVEKSCTLGYLVRFHSGLKRNIFHAILSMSLEEFKEYTHIYEAAEIYNDADLLQRCYEYVVKRPKVWPINLYIHLSNLFKYLQSKDITLSEADLKDISPKLLHWDDLTTLTNYDYIVAWDYYKCSGKKMRKNKTLLEPYRQKFYAKCWFYDKWLWYTPKFVTKLLDENLTERNETVAEEENTVFEQSVVVHAISQSKQQVTDNKPNEVHSHRREYSTEHENAACSTALPTSNTRPFGMVDAEIQTSQGLLATITNLHTKTPNSAARPFLESFLLPSKAIKKEKLEPLNNLQFNLTKDEENYECVPLPDDIVELSSTESQQKELLFPLSNSETLAAADFNLVQSCESGVSKNGDKKSESPNCALNSQRNCLEEEAHEEDAGSETLTQNACLNEEEVDESMSSSLEQTNIEAETQSHPREAMLVEEQQQQVYPDVKFDDIPPLQQNQVEETAENSESLLQEQRLVLGTAIKNMIEATLLSQKKKKQQQQNTKKLESATVFKNIQQSKGNNQQEEEFIENNQQQQKVIVNEQQQQQQSVESEQQQQPKPMEKEQQQQQKAIENEQPGKSLEYKQKQQSLENKQQQQQQSVVNKQPISIGQHHTQVKVVEQQKQMQINAKQKLIKKSQQQQQPIRNSTTQQLPEAEEIEQLANEKISKEQQQQQQQQQQKEEEKRQTSFVQSTQYSTEQEHRQEISMEPQSVQLQQQHQSIQQEPMPHEQQQQPKQPVTVQKSQKINRKSESKEQQQTIEQRGTQLSQLKEHATQQCVQQLQQQKTLPKETQQKQQGENEDLTQWLLQVATQYKQHQHQQQPVSMQKQQTAVRQQQIGELQEVRTKKHQQQQKHNQHTKLQQQQQLQQYTQPQILLQRTSTQIQEQVVIKPVPDTLTPTDVSSQSYQLVNRPATIRVAETKTVKQTKLPTTTRKAAKISDYVPQLTHDFPPLPIGLNIKKTLLQPAASAPAGTTTTRTTDNMNKQNQLDCEQMIPANNFTLTPLPTATPPMLVALPMSMGNASGATNASFVYTLSGDSTLFNSSELFKLLEEIQLQRSQQQHQQQQQPHLQSQQLQLPQQQQFEQTSPQQLVLVQPDMLQHQQQQQQQQQLQLQLQSHQFQQQHLQVQQLQLPQQQQAFEQTSPQQMVLVQPDMLQQQQLQLQLQPHQFQQQQQQSQQQQLQPQQQQLEQKPQLSQQQFHQQHLEEQQLRLYNQPQLLEQQQLEPQQQLQHQQPYHLPVCHLVDATAQALPCAGGQENENFEQQQQLSAAQSRCPTEYEYKNATSLQQLPQLYTEQYPHLLNCPFTNIPSDMLQVNICVEHNHCQTPSILSSPNLVTPALPSPKGPTRMCTPARLKQFFCRRIEKLDYFSEVTAMNIAEYQLQCSSIGQSFLQAKIRTSQLRTVVWGDVLPALLPRCTPNLIEDLLMLLQYVGEFHFDLWQQQRQRNFLSKCTHRTLHTLCAHVLLLFFAYSIPFQTKSLNMVEEMRSNVFSAYVAGESVNKDMESFGDLSLAIDPSILEQIAALKRKL